MARFIYTFGSSESFPYRGGWVEVIADDLREAHKKFRAHFPDQTPGILNCCDYYTEDQFIGTDMPITGNRGEYCYEIID